MGRIGQSREWSGQGSSLGDRPGVAAAIAAPGMALVVPLVQFALHIVVSPLGEAGGMQCPLASWKVVDTCC